MGYCISKTKDSNPNPKITKVKKSNRQLKVGVKFKEIEFGGFIGFSTTINDFYENHSSASTYVGKTQTIPTVSIESSET